MTVEESIVGGLVHGLMPGFLENHIFDFPRHFIEEDIQAKQKFKQYILLQKGIRIVEELGIKQVILLYQENPLTFKKLLQKRKAPSKVFW